MIYEQLSFLKDITWMEIWDEWKKDEEEQAFWRNIYYNLNYSSWEEWRENCLSGMDFQSKKWSLYLVKDPLYFAAHTYCCPFSAWYKYYSKHEIPTKEERDKSFFAHVVPRSSLSQNEKILGILKSFPSKTQILGITNGYKVMLFEGHHRCSALTLAYLKGIELNNIELTIALCEYSSVEFSRAFYPFLKDI